MNNEIISHNGIKTFTITSQPFYDQYNQCYKNILMVNAEPRGPIRRIVRRIRIPRLSPFQREGPCNPIPNCGLALQSLNEYGTKCCKLSSGCNLMTSDEIPDLISFLFGNGYQIETQITNMLNQSEVKLSNKKISFLVTYYGVNEPNITYMR
jgi:hypothetical protein